jgi:hypothetical protein
MPLIASDAGVAVERGWTSDEYRDWLADALKRELLGGED